MDLAEIRKAHSRGTSSPSQRYFAPRTLLVAAAKMFGVRKSGGLDPAGPIHGPHRPVSLQRRSASANPSVRDSGGTQALHSVFSLGTRLFQHFPATHPHPPSSGPLHEAPRKKCPSKLASAASRGQGVISTKPGGGFRLMAGVHLVRQGRVSPLPAATARHTTSFPEPGDRPPPVLPGPPVSCWLPE